ncbi:hypothetical protein GQ600_7732 [Phytophthora cactorum]|nr:hypothetical protein GQ600_7732 [Phytophthora cactorum]
MHCNIQYQTPSCDIQATLLVIARGLPCNSAAGYRRLCGLTAEHTVSMQSSGGYNAYFISTPTSVIGTLRTKPKVSE